MGSLKIYNLLLSHVCELQSVGDVEKWSVVMNIKDNIQSVGVRPNVETFNSLARIVSQRKVRFYFRIRPSP